MLIYRVPKYIFGISYHHALHLIFKGRNPFNLRCEVQETRAMRKRSISRPIHAMSNVLTHIGMWKFWLASWQHDNLPKQALKWPYNTPTIERAPESCQASCIDEENTIISWKSFTYCFTSPRPFTSGTLPISLSLSLSLFRQAASSLPRDWERRSSRRRRWWRLKKADTELQSRLSVRQRPPVLCARPSRTHSHTPGDTILILEQNLTSWSDKDGTVHRIPLNMWVN